MKPAPGYFNAPSLRACFEQVGLTAFNLEEISTVFFHDGAGLRVRAVQQIGGDDFTVQRGQVLQQGGGGGLFA